VARGERDPSRFSQKTTEGLLGVESEIDKLVRKELLTNIEEEPLSKYRLLQE
jgi:hypothetical protein